MSLPVAGGGLNKGPFQAKLLSDFKKNIKKILGSQLDLSSFPQRMQEPSRSFLTAAAGGFTPFSWVQPQRAQPPVCTWAEKTSAQRAISAKTVRPCTPQSPQDCDLCACKDLPCHKIYASQWEEEAVTNQQFISTLAQLFKLHFHYKLSNHFSPAFTQKFI